MSDAIFYVYQYITENGLPYYIGKGKENRISEPHHRDIVVPDVKYRIYVQTYMADREALALENQLIRHYGRKIDGGILENIKINQWAGSSGWKHREETKQKISNSLKGRVFSEETKAKYKKPKTAAHAEKIRQANIGRQDDGRNSKISETMKGRPWSESRRNAYLQSKQKKELNNVVA